MKIFSKKYRIHSLIIISLLLITIIATYLSYRGYPITETERSDQKEQPVRSIIDDGPYVFERDDSRLAIWVCKGQIKQSEFVYRPEQVIENCGKSNIIGRKQPLEINQLVYQGDFNVAAVSDIHGQFKLFYKLLQNNKIIDLDGNWNFSTGHLIVTGDVFDRGVEVTEALWFLYNLENQAAKAGGKLHYLLGNHEVMVLNDDLRYVNDKYFEAAQILEIPYAELFARGSVLGDWLRSRSVLIKVNGMLFAHGGFHPYLVDQKMSLNTINDIFKQNLIKNELNSSRKEWGDYLHSDDGPIWYRGYFKNQQASSAEIDNLLKHFEITHLVVGHTTQDQIETRYEGKVIAIDARMKAGKQGEILLWRNGEFSRGTLDGQQFLLTQANQAYMNSISQISSH